MLPYGFIMITKGVVKVLSEEIFKRALESKQSSALLKKAALNLQQAFLAQQQEQRAMFYQNIANQQP